MKNLSLALNAVLAVAVVVLYVLHFNGQKTEPIMTTEEIKPTEQMATSASIAEAMNVEVDASSSNLPVAWVSLDSINDNYEYIKRLENQIKAKAKREDANFKKKEDAFRRQVAVFQENLQNGVYKTEAEAQKRQESLLIQEQELGQERQKVNYDLQSQQLEMRNQIAKKISDYLEGYSKRLNYSYIMATGEGSSVLFAHDSLNITASVLKGLNSEYKK